jgi:hypothetical protein
MSKAKTKAKTKESLEFNTCYWTANCYREDRPKTGTLEQTLVVHDGCEKGLIVEVSDIVTQPESWGMYLAAIGHVISESLAEPHGLSPEEAMAEIQKGFLDSCRN